MVKLAELFLLFLLPGWLTLAAARKGKRQASPGRSGFLFLAVTVSFTLSSLFGLILAQAGLFSVLRVSFLQLIYSVLVLVFFRPPLGLPPPAGGAAGPAGFILPLIMVLALLLFFRPAEYIFGGWDPGVYANTAVYLARTGAIVVDDQLFGTLTPEEKREFSQRHTAGYLERYPGFRFSARTGSRVIPQFYHLFPVWLAVFYSWAGLKGMFYLNPVLGLLALLSVYRLVCEFWGKKAALIAVFLLAVNLVQIWQARFPTSEMLGQFLLFGGLFLLTRYLDGGETLPAWLAGAVLGIFVLSRLSSLLLLVPLAVFFYLRWFVSFRKKDLNFWIPLLLLTAYSFLPHLVLDLRYLSSSLGAFRTGWSGWWLCGGVFLGGAGVARFAPRRKRERLLARAGGKAGRWLGAGAVVALAWYGYFIRPYMAIASADKTNLVELGWLLTAPGLLLGCLGICLLILKNRNPAVWLFLLVLFTFSGLFLWQQMIHYYYMWAARRYAVAVVPGFLACAAFSIVTMARNRFRGVRLTAVAAFLLLIVLEVSAGRVIYAHREYEGAIDLMGKVAGRLEDADLVVVEGAFVDKLPTVLDLTCGYRVLPLYRGNPARWPLILRAARSARGGDAEPRIYLLTDGAPPAHSGLDFVPLDEFPFHSALLERRADRLPRRLDEMSGDANFTVRVYRVVQRQG